MSTGESLPPMMSNNVETIAMESRATCYNSQKKDHVMQLNQSCHSVDQKRQLKASAGRSLSFSLFPILQLNCVIVRLMLAVCLAP